MSKGSEVKEERESNINQHLRMRYGIYTKVVMCPARPALCSLNSSLSTALKKAREQKNDQFKRQENEGSSNIQCKGLYPEEKAVGEGRDAFRKQKRKKKLTGYLENKL
jgi:hypothetical protein